MLSSGQQPSSLSRSKFPIQQLELNWSTNESCEIDCLSLGAPTGSVYPGTRVGRKLGVGFERADPRQQKAWNEEG